MRVKLIMPALTEAVSPYWRSIKYSLFPPLGLATLAAYLRDDDEVEIQDEHVERLGLDDEPDLAAIQVLITSAHRAYEIADRYRSRGVHVVLGGLHVTALPDEAARHADTIVLGPGEEAWREFLGDFRAGRPGRRYRSKNRILDGMPKIRRDLIKRHLYLVPNSTVVSRGCPCNCDFCYKESFFRGGKSYYTLRVSEALEQISELPGRHVFFLDDHLFGNVGFASALFDGMRGMGRLWQAAGTVKSVLNRGLLEKAVKSGLRSLFIGFETLSPGNLREHNKQQDPAADYEEAIYRLHNLGVMINGSFVFGMDKDGPDVFERTVEWALEHGIETATFHILTPYPGTRLRQRMSAQGRIVTDDWDLYDTRHAVYRPAGMTVGELEEGYWGAYRNFYRWGSIFRSASSKETMREVVRHLAYTGGWKKLEPFWNIVIRARKVGRMLPLLESLLSGFGKFSANGEKAPQEKTASLSGVCHGG